MKRMALVLGLIGCVSERKVEGEDDGSWTPITEVALDNRGAASVTVTLSSGEASVDFGELPAGTASEYEDVDDWALDEVLITVTDGSAMGGTVVLEEDYLNVVLLSDTEAPVVEQYEPAPPSGVGDPGGGAAGW